jgi:hypothetical protein
MLADMLHRLLQSENELEARRHRLANPQPERLALWPRFADQGILGAPFSQRVQADLEAACATLRWSWNTSAAG